MLLCVLIVQCCGAFSVAAETRAGTLITNIAKAQEGKEEGMWLKDRFGKYYPGLIAGAVAVFLGVLLIIAGVVSFYVIKAQIKNAIEDYVVVDSVDHDNYEDWENNTGEDSAPLYVDFYFFNLTNGDEVLAGTQTPKYDTVGPYVHRKLFTKINVTFTDGGNLAELGWWTYYVPQPDLSNASLTTDLITNLNQAYIFLITQAGSESNLISAATPSFISKILTELQTSFGPQVIERSFPTIAKNYHDNLLTNFYNDNTTEFYEIWANSLVVPPDNPTWQSFSVLSNGRATPSNLNESQCAYLWLEHPDLPNLANNNTISTYLWLTASVGNQTSKDTLSQLLSVSLAQLDILLLWRYSFNTRVTQPSVFGAFGVTSNSELAWLQFGSGNVTSYVSIQSSFSLPVIPELGIWSRDVYTNDSANYIDFNATFTAFLFADNSTGLLQLLNFGSFVSYIQTSNAEKLDEIWHLTLPQAIAIASYFRYIGAGLVTPTIASTFAVGGGLMTTRTAEQWLWGAKDPLLNLLYPANDVVAYYTNQTTLEDADQYLEETGYSILYTGRGDVNNVATYKQWEGKQYLPAGKYWRDNVTVTGTSGTQFGPGVTKDEQLTVWVDEIVRGLHFNYQEEVSEKGIDLLRYIIKEEDFNPSELYFSQEKGFANMSNVYNIPVMMSKPNFLDCEVKWQEKLEGVTPDSTRDDTFIDVEPITGKVLSGIKQLQVGIYVQAEGEGPLDFDVWNKAIGRDVIYPVFYAKEHSVITDKLADDFKSGVYKVIFVRNLLFWLGLGIGFALLIIGVLVIAVLAFKNKKRYETYGGYETVE
eukprot:TRINITY_DN3391_c0_g1_i1.p1 TRINITY_DN3391_c0_g1~~TRINITY_DN3391_c0_g1_i1.p1  ORF type:complete len:815 (-),score=167.55 TRINITY_DN3391_c0_g1_i1:52-2496(-)